MGETKHTPGRLAWTDHISPHISIYATDDSGKIVHVTEPTYRDGAGVAVANADRIVAAWNACDGISTEALEGGVVGKLRAYAECQEAFERHDVRAIGIAELAEIFRRHGWDDEQPMQDFLRDLRYAALAAARGPEQGRG